MENSAHSFTEGSDVSLTPLTKEQSQYLSANGFCFNLKHSEQIDQSIENWNALKHEYDKMEAQYKYCQELNAELLAAVKIAKFHVPSINYKSHWDIIQSAINKTESK